MTISANPALTQANYTQISDGNVVFENYSDDGTHLVMTQIDLGESVIINEFHNGILIDSLTIEKNEKSTENNVTNAYKDLIVPFANPNLTGTIKMGNVYYDVQAMSGAIRMDLRYKNDGAPQQTTYTIKNRYVSLTSLAIDLAAALFMPQSLAITFAQKLIGWGVVKSITGGIEKISSTTVAALAQNQFVYAYLPRQYEQFEISRTLTGTIYTVNDTTSSKFSNQKFSIGFTNDQFGQNSFGILLGQKFWTQYFSVNRWVK